MTAAQANEGLRTYYAQRAGEYERIYRKPERQLDLERLRRDLPRLFDGLRVLEIACGTGYWTEQLAGSAHSVLAVDVNEEVLEIARYKAYPRRNVRFACMDVYALAVPDEFFDAGFAGFWWSHVPRRELGHFLARFHGCLAEGARVAVLDNRYVPGSSTPISRVDEHGDSHQLRSLGDGTHYEVLKNFPGRDELERQLAPHARDLAYVELDYYWYVTYRVTHPA